ncbi:MAG: glucoamylase family protein, partial [Polaromonas sp.]
LDNFPLIEAQLQQIREGVPRSYYASLPKLAAAPLQGLPRVYGIAWAYVAHTDSVLNPELFTAFLNAYQDWSELRLSELWALPTTLRVVLLENLRRMADDIALGKVAREVAHAVWDSAAQLDSAALDTIYVLMKQRGLQRSYLTQLWQRMPTELPETVPVLARWTEEHCPDGHALMIQSQTGQVASNLTVGNIITTLRLIGQVDWVDLIEPVSRSLRVLRQLPSFREESELTRQQITQAMERLARQSRTSEREVAEALVAAALNVAEDLPAEAEERTAGFYLIGEGRAALETSLGVTTSDTARHERQRKWHLPLYVAVIMLATLLLVFLVAQYHAEPGWKAIVALFLLAWPVSEAVSALVHRLIAESLEVHPLPRLDFSAGIPPGHRVLVVIPTLLTSAASNKDLVQRLEWHWLANREKEAQFALLTDWIDAASASLPGDAALLQDALARLAVLNARYPATPDESPRFVLMHRPRSWCKTQRRWLGRERKRGKLEQLLRLLATGSMEGFTALAPGLRLADGIRYVVTLDSDTGLPPGSLRDLVAVAAHPLNAPRVDPASRRVVKGYGILQPRVVTPLPDPAQDTPYHRLFAGQGGIDPYSSGVSDVYQDLFGSGSFSGKGLLHVDAVHAVLDGRLPAESVLSHDLLEGTVARCGFVSDVALVEEHPHHAGVAASRNHRWTRGDWQLLPLMARARRYGIDALGLWKMGDNLRRSLVMPLSFALIAWVIFTGSLPLHIALLATLAALLAGPLLGALAGLVPTRRGIAWRHFFREGSRQLVRAVGAAAWNFSQIPVQSLMLLDATVRSLWRMTISQRHLLEWTTAAQAQAASKTDLSAFVRQHAPASLLCAALAIATPWALHPWAGLLLFLFWGGSALAAWWSSLPCSAGAAHVLRAKDRHYLEMLARDTWRFFERCVGAEDNHLPPDNLQLVPEPTVAHRTSPTNVGLYLLAACCAREFGWISTGELIKRLEATLDTLDQLPKHRGHLLNWYDTRTLAIMQPAYVSTVDSGNLAGLLLAVAQACLSLAEGGSDGPVAQIALRQLAARCQALYAAMDFHCLYDSKRHLFNIGLRVEEQSLDASYYDLLASESRLTSFLAIAKGDVPRRHWTALGRPFLSVGGAPGLKSWSGSMFEYLMPSLLMHEPRHGLLQTSVHSAVAAQRVFGAEQQLPWGISESAYFAQDHSLAYQYSPFGVPRLALRRTPLTDRVVAPYATLIATLVSPGAAVANLKRLERLGARGELGMFEALDFTVSRQPDKQAVSIVQAFMAHHQGMSLVALCNVLRLDAPRRWFAAEAQVAAHEALLHERTPRQIVESADPRLPPEPDAHSLEPVFHSRTVQPLKAGWKPTHLLSNGRYNVALRPNGAGLSRWQGRNVTRWRDDVLRDAYGSFFYLRRSGQRSMVSLTATPAPGADWRYRARFMADRVQFDAQGESLSTSITVIVSPEDDTELRSVQLHNTGRSELRLELVSCFEAVLADPRADDAHPAFSNLFVQTRWEPEWRALMLTRRPRLHGDPQMAVAHFLAEADADVISVKCIADRRVFAGRGQPPHQPALLPQVFDEDNLPVNGLDPVASLRVRLRLAPGAIARLSFATTAADTAEELAARIDKYLQPMHVERATRMAATLAQVRLRDLALTPAEHLALQDLTTALMYSTPRPGLERIQLDQRQLWRFGISGDKPIVLVRIKAPSGLPLVNALLRAQPWWTFGGLAVDVVVINSEPNSYLMPLQRDIL